MARCPLGAKKVRQLAHDTGLRICAASVRGGNGHRIDLYLDDQRVVSYWRNTGLVTKWCSDEPLEIISGTVEAGDTGLTWCKTPPVYASVEP